MAGEQELKMKNKNKEQNIIFIVNVMRTNNLHKHTHGRLITRFQTKEDNIHSTYLSLKIIKIKIKTLYQFFYQQKKIKIKIILKRGPKSTFIFFPFPHNFRRRIRNPSN